MIEEMILKNFTVFDGELNMQFSPKINIIIGENGTGKTHLLKGAYAMCSGAQLFKSTPDADDSDLEAFLTTKLLRLFMPLDDKLGKMHHNGALEQANIYARLDKEKEIAATFFNNSKALDIKNRKNYRSYSEEPVFIPTKEVISFMKGFTSLYEKYGLSFDQTYNEICLLLDLPEVRRETLHEKSKWAMDEIEGICGGRFIFYGGGKVTFKSENSEYSANSIAEGFRKVGMLARLLETGAIQPGVSGPLFWDEPETSLNPKLMKLLVQLLFELSRNGQQIILATHDYVFLKWFDLLADEKKEDHVRFHALYRDPETDRVLVDSVDSYNAISPNAISDTFNDLTKEQVSKSMGNLGK